MFGKKKDETRVIISDCVAMCNDGYIGDPKRSKRCPKWVILTQNYVDDKGSPMTREEGRCAIAWIPQMLIELRASIEKVR